jgi:WD40 repeat protein
VDTLTGQVIRVDLQTGAIEEMATLGVGLDNLAFDSHDRLFVSNVVDGYIARVYPDGQMRIINKSGFVQPGGIAAVPDAHGEKSVYIADVYSLRKLDSRSGREEIVYTGTSGIAYPMTVAPYGDDIVLSSWFSNTVQVWDTENEQLSQNYDNFASPMNAIGFQDTLIVAELGKTAGAARVLQVRDGETITLADITHNIYVPIGLAATEEDLWVSDWATGMVWQIVGPGELAPIASGLASPEGLAVDREGNLLVVEAGAQRLSRIELTTGETSIVKEDLALGAEGIPGMPPAWTFNGVAVDEGGAIYITGDKKNVVYKSVGFSR